MKLYDSDMKFCHCDFKTSLTNDMTITFNFKFKSCLDRDYVLIDKEGEFLVKLSKKNKIYFYIGDKSGTMKIQAKTEELPSCEWLTVAIVRNIECKRTNIFVNCKLNVSDCIDEEHLTISKSCSDVVTYVGSECESYEMCCVKIHNEVLNFNEIKGFDCCDKKYLFEQIFCNMYETNRFDDNTYHYIMTPKGIVFFPNESKKVDRPITITNLSVYVKGKRNTNGQSYVGCTTLFGKQVQYTLNFDADNSVPTSLSNVTITILGNTKPIGIFSVSIVDTTKFSGNITIGLLEINQTVRNQYNEFAYRYYNIEHNEKCLPIDGIKCSSWEELCKFFNVDEFVTNLVTWQFQDTNCEFQQAHPKNIQSNPVQVGYWSHCQGLTPFTPWLGTDSPIESNTQAGIAGNLKNGMVISFVKLLIEQYICTQNEIYRKSLDKLVTYLIDMSTVSSDVYGSGVPDAFPRGSVHADANDTFTSIQSGNYLNYLKVLDCILKHENVRNIVDDTRISTLKTIYDEKLSLLLKLQVQCGGRLSIWSEFYNYDSMTGLYTPARNDVLAQTININSVLVNGNNEPSPSALLTVPESVEILNYLMNIKCPTTDVKKAVRAGIEWLKMKKLDKYIQYFNDATCKMEIKKNNYVTGPTQTVLHPHYYTLNVITSSDLVPTPVVACGAVFITAAPSANTGVFATGDTVFPANFNSEDFADQIDQFGTWAQCAIDLYEQWVTIYDTPCLPTTSVSKSKTTCKCNHKSH